MTELTLEQMAFEYSTILMRQALVEDELNFETKDKVILSIASDSVKMAQALKDALREHRERWIEIA